MSSPLVLFGGTFDPVHRAHISCARAVSKALNGAMVELLPNAVPPHRDQPGTSAADRLAMLELACAPHPELTVNDWELTQSGPSWTRLTLEHFRSRIGQRPLVLVIGADSLASLQHWRDWQQFPSLCHLVVLPRPGANAPEQAVLDAFPEASVGHLLSHPAGCRLMLTRPSLDVSATAIRQALSQKGTCPAVDAEVLAHIRSHRLYNVSPELPEGASGDTDNHHNHNGNA